MYRALCPFFEKWSIVTPGTWTTRLGTFLVLVKYTEKQYSLRTEMITLTKAALEKLDH
jgi:hypothetical protein